VTYLCVINSNGRNMDMTPQDVKDFRARHKLSQRAAAKRTGTGYVSWHNWEHGKTAPPAWIRHVFAAVDAGIA
jgi:DNA-binding transcriptional regulator YiaG